MARRRGYGRSPKVGIFTNSQFSALTYTADQCRNRMHSMRLKGATMKRDNLLSLFIKEEHRQVLTDVGKLVDTGGMKYLGAYTTAEYVSPLGHKLSHRVMFMARADKVDFLVPTYADTRVNYERNDVPVVKLDAPLQKYVDSRLALAIEFGLLKTMLVWFGGAKLSVPQMVYLLPSMASMLAQSPSTRELADRCANAKVPSDVPPLPGERAAFGLVEGIVSKAIMLLNEPGSGLGSSNSDISLDVRFKGDIEFMGWKIELG